MAQIKLLFPTLANAGSLFPTMAPHSALLSLARLDDRTQDTQELGNLSLRQQNDQKIKCEKL